MLAHVCEKFFASGVHGRRLLKCEGQGGFQKGTGSSTVWLETVKVSNLVPWIAELYTQISPKSSVFEWENQLPARVAGNHCISLCCPQKGCTKSWLLTLGVTTMATGEIYKHGHGHLWQHVATTKDSWRVHPAVAPGPTANAG